MDFDSIKNQVSNLTLYDLKAGFRKAQNAVMNYTEMESKVREATNNEPWGASSTLMQEIANGTFNYAQLNEIMPMIYKRFTEKAAEEWRQIYKSLQLLEFLIKNGSERVIDDARGHVSLLKMLRQFHYIDQNGKDQGLNVRNRAKELAELLSDVDRIRAERKKSKSTRNKYGGVEGGMGMGIGGTGSSRYGGFGSETDTGSYGGYSGGVYGDGGGFGGNTNDYGDTQGRRERFEEYDEYDEGAVASPGRRKQDSFSSPTSSRRVSSKPEKPKEPEVDLFDFSADDTTTSTVPASSNTQTMSGFGNDDDDFDDFQSAAPPIAPPAQPQSQAFTSPTSTQFAAPVPLAPPQGSTVNNLYSSISPPPQQSAMPLSPSASQGQGMQQNKPMAPMQVMSASKPSGYQAAAPNYFASVQASAPGQQLAGAASPGLSSGSSGKKPAAGGDPFANLMGGGGAGAKKTGAAAGKQTMADLAKQKANAGIWGTTGTSSQPSQQQGSGGAAGGGDSGNLLF